MTRDAVVVSVLIVAFATFVTVHVTIVLGLAVRPRRHRAVVALVAFPLAAWWGFREKMWIRSSLWVLSAVVYGVAFGYAQR
jgi:hypothetical protein